MAPPPPATVTLDSNTRVEPDRSRHDRSLVRTIRHQPDAKQLAVTADNHLAIPSSTPTTLSMPLTDLVTISRAEYSLNSGQITVVASTSDETSPPVLTVTSGTGVAIGTLSGDGAVKSLATGISPIPPDKVRVTSSNGGTDTEEVVIVQ